MKPGSVVIVSSGDSFMAGILTEMGDRTVAVCLENERTVKFSPKKITLELGVEITDFSSLVVRADFFSRIAEISERLDLAEVWEFATSEGLTTLSAEDAANLAGLDGTPPEVAAVILSVLTNPVYFKMKDSCLVPYGREAVDNLLRQRNNEISRNEVLEKGCSALVLIDPGQVHTRDFDEFCASMPEEAVKIVRAVRDTALNGDASPSAGLAKDAVGRLGIESGKSLPLACFGLMVRLGLWNEDANLSVESLGLSPDFPEDVEAALQPLDESFIVEASRGRTDYTEMTVISVDDESTADIDDAFGFDFHDDDTATLRVFIADPSEFLGTGPVFDQGRARGATLYLPTGRIPMIPPSLSEDLASLNEGRNRLAVVFSLPVDSAGNCGTLDIGLGVVKVSRRLTYDEADEALECVGTETRNTPCLSAAALKALTTARDLSVSWVAQRASKGAVLLSRREVSVKVDEGKVSVRAVQGNSPSRKTIQELMIKVNAMTAAFCAERGIGSVFRRQDLPDGIPAAAAEKMATGEEISDPVMADAILRGMRKAVISTIPEPHSSLGVDSYTQVTSPLRRFQDLVMHMQLKAFLAGSPSMDKEELMAMFLELEDTSSNYARIERESRRYWILKHLSGLLETGPVVLEGFVADVRGGRADVTLQDFDLRVKVPASKGLEKGQIRSFSVRRANAREDVLAVDPLD